MELPNSSEPPPKTLTVVCALLRALAEGVETEVIEKNDTERIKAEIVAEIFLLLFKILRGISILILKPHKLVLVE